MSGGRASSSSAWAISAAATRPDRCDWRPDSSGKTSKMANCESPSRTANHAVVSGSSSASERPLSRNLATSASLPGLASSGTHSPLVTVAMTSPFRRSSAGAPCYGGARNYNIHLTCSGSAALSDSQTADFARAARAGIDPKQQEAVSWLRLAGRVSLVLDGLPFGAADVVDDEVHDCSDDREDEDRHQPGDRLTERPVAPAPDDVEERHRPNGNDEHHE